MSEFILAVLLALVAMLANGEYLLGSSMLSRPIVTGTLAGLVMGDVVTGVTIGATLELAFVGNFSIGASIPPEMISGGVLGTAFAIQSGTGPEVALALALPIASLVLVVKNLGFLFVLPPFVHKADRYALEANSKGISRMNLLGGFFAVNLPIGLMVGIGYYLGSPVIEKLLDVIPKFIMNGLTIAVGLLPAYGFALLANMMLKKGNWVYLLLGFALVVYLKLSVTGITIFGLVIALILVGYSSFNGGNGNGSKGKPVIEGGFNEYDEEF